MAVAGFVISIISLVMSWFIIFDLILIIPAIVFSAIGWRKAKKERRPYGGLAIAGVVISIVAFIFMALAVVWFRNAFNS